MCDVDFNNKRGKIVVVAGTGPGMLSKASGFCAAQLSLGQSALTDIITCATTAAATTERVERRRAGLEMEDEDGEMLVEAVMADKVLVLL